MKSIIRNAVVALLLVGVFSASGRTAEGKPAPTGESLDSFQYVFTKGFWFPGTVTLTVTKAGKVAYHYKQPFRGSESRIVSEEWSISEKEATALLGAIVEDGLLELDVHDDILHAVGPYHHIFAKAGRWQLTIHPKAFPERILRHLRPLMRVAHPGKWEGDREGLRSLPNEEEIDYFSTHFQKSYGDNYSVSVTRAGKVTYTFNTSPDIGRAAEMPVRKSWEIPEKQAVALLAALVADGVLKSGKADDEGKGPKHTIGVRSGRWSLSVPPKSLSEKSFLRLLPLLRTGDPKVWKDAK